ncbi:FtsW/RodA/SpoVE family cell cycle protein [Flaviaesturariibacter amylovorans]|uniref:Penicillin-binding protein transpeptidase domain-containing protein n=1 Tax=Flaviaesturariibacter amylovorans TaxID=1084520 RepID=A0ABP8GKD5_9BACT
MNRIGKRGIERILLVLIAGVLGAFFFRLYEVLEKDFAEVAPRLQDGSMVHLNAPAPADALAKLLRQGYYLEDPRDITLIRNSVAVQLTPGTRIDNIGELNKRAYNIPAEDALHKGGAVFHKRARLSYRLLGFSGPDSVRYAQELRSAPPLPPTVDLGAGGGRIAGRIEDREGAAVGGALVRLELVLPQDSIYTGETDEEDLRETVTPTLRYRRGTNGKYASLAAYARTDAQGKFSFTGLQEGAAWEVLPLQPGSAFGAPKGTSSLKGTLDLSFTRSPHTLRLFSGRDFNNLKREKALIVRTPEEVRQWYWIIVAAFLLPFFAVHGLLSAKLRTADAFILPLIMLLTGISLLTLLSLQDPLRDRFLALNTLWYFLGGMAVLTLMLLFDLRRFTPDAGFYRMFAVKGRSGERGLQWAAFAVVLLLATIALGSGPEGSGVKVNLFGFQPSEVIKFGLLLFLAGFLAANERFIAEYATAGRRWKFFYPALGAVLLAILLFLMLGDLGPAVVVCFSFIILFSFTRGDFAVMAGTVALYVLANWIFDNVWIATGVTVLALAVYLRFGYKRLSESAVMALVVLAGFLLIDQVPLLDRLFPGPVQRLADRKAIWQNNWDNEVYGGDQVANGIWAMASGGTTGQGIGEGFAKTIPEAHTDMILPAIGEELGWTGIGCLFVLFLVYLHRALLIGRQTGRPFLFYLAGGIGVSTFVQFLLIAGGSTGALPLSGIALPFISYGGSSLLCNLLAAGFLLSASFVRGSEVQMAYISKQQDRNLVPALAAATLGIILLTVNVSRYLFKPAEWVVQPALVADRSGARMFSYNPRIAILMNKLEAGALYDRQGRLLATSRKERLLSQRDTLVQGGVLPENIVRLSHQRNDRYYPYGDQMFFWTGDANTGVFTGSLNGYFAEYELGAELRGFPMPETTYPVKASRFREDRFLPPAEREMTVLRRDYSALSPMLLAGINSRLVEDFKKQNRDVQLSMDAGLQTALQRSFSLDDSLRSRRVSVVVLEDSTGDVLTSAGWPLPPVNDWEQLTLTPREAARAAGWLTLKDLGFTHATQPGSTAKLATALAALNKYGAAIATKPITVREQDLIRIKGPEPDEPGRIDMQRALVRSNNAYFIRLANEQRIEEQMGTLYLQTGMFLRGVGGYFFERPPGNDFREEGWRETWRKTEFRSIRRYDVNNPRKTRGLGISGMAWGQGELTATPAAVARLASGIAHGGIVPHRFVLKIADSAVASKPAVPVAADPGNTALLTAFMKAQSAGKVKQLGIQVAGKTGTPERIFRGRRINDGWYVFFAPKATGAGHIVVCIRIEDTKGSSDAVRTAGRHVIPELLRRGYIRGFGNASGGARTPGSNRAGTDSLRIDSGAVVPLNP